MDEAVAKTELLLYYIKRHDAAAVEAMIQGGADVNARSSDTSPMLEVAVESKNVEIVQLLIAAGADVNGADAYHRTPLLRAVALGDLGMCRLLIAAGAGPARDVHASDVPAVYLSPYQLAMRESEVEIAWLLFECLDEDPSQRTVRGLTMEELIPDAGEGSELLRTMMVAHALRSGIGATGESATPRPCSGLVL
jgi:ankyrin repeat protein